MKDEEIQTSLSGFICGKLHPNNRSHPHSVYDQHAVTDTVYKSVTRGAGDNGEICVHMMSSAVQTSHQLVTGVSALPS